MFCGYILKRNRELSPPSMQRVYCVLWGTLLLDFDSEDEAKISVCPKVISEIVGVSEWEGQGRVTQYPNGFLLVTHTGCTYYLSGSTPRDRAEWILHVRRALECTFANEAVKDYKPTKYVQPRPPLGHGADCPRTSHPLLNLSSACHCRCCGRAFSSVEFVQEYAPMLQIGAEEAERCCSDCKLAQACIIWLKCLNYSHLMTLHDMSSKVATELTSHFKATFKLKRRASKTLEDAAQLLELKQITLEEFRELQGLEQRARSDRTYEEGERLRNALEVVGFDMQMLISLLLKPQSTEGGGRVSYLEVLLRLLRIADSEPDLVDFYLPQLMQVHLSEAAQRSPTSMYKVDLLQQALLVLAQKHPSLALKITWLLCAAVVDHQEKKLTQAQCAACLCLLLQLEMVVTGYVSCIVDVASCNVLSKLLQPATHQKQELGLELSGLFLIRRRLQEAYDAEAAARLERLSMAQDKDADKNQGSNFHLMSEDAAISTASASEPSHTRSPSPTDTERTGKDRGGGSENGNDIKSTFGSTFASHSWTPYNFSNPWSCIELFQGLGVGQASTPRSPKAREAADWADQQAQHFNLQLDFVARITNFVDSLRQVDRAQRTDTLCAELTHLNETPDQLGWDPCVGAGEPSYRIVRILVEDCRVFRTKARAPSLIVCEVVRQDIDKPEYMSRHRDTAASLTTCAIVTTEPPAAVVLAALESPSPSLASSAAQKEDADLGPIQCQEEDHQLLLAAQTKRKLSVSHGETGLGSPITGAAMAIPDGLSDVADLVESNIHKAIADIKKQSSKDSADFGLDESLTTLSPPLSAVTSAKEEGVTLQDHDGLDMTPPNTVRVLMPVAESTQTAPDASADAVPHDTAQQKRTLNSAEQINTSPSDRMSAPTSSASSPPPSLKPLQQHLQMSKPLPQGYDSASSSGRGSPLGTVTLSTKSRMSPDHAQSSNSGREKDRDSAGRDMEAIDAIYDAVETLFLAPKKLMTSSRERTNFVSSSTSNTPHTTGGQGHGQLQTYTPGHSNGSQSGGGYSGDMGDKHSQSNASCNSIVSIDSTRSSAESIGSVDTDSFRVKRPMPGELEKPRLGLGLGHSNRHHNSGNGGNGHHNRSSSLHCDDQTVTQRRSTLSALGFLGVGAGTSSFTSTSAVIASSSTMQHSKSHNSAMTPNVSLPPRVTSGRSSPSITPTTSTSQPQPLLNIPPLAPIPRRRLSASLLPVNRKSTNLLTMLIPQSGSLPSNLDSLGSRPSGSINATITNNHSHANGSKSPALGAVEAFGIATSSRASMLTRIGSDEASAGPDTELSPEDEGMKIVREKAQQLLDEGAIDRAEFEQLVKSDSKYRNESKREEAELTMTKVEHAFGESWQAKRERVLGSRCDPLENEAGDRFWPAWDLRAFIIKSHDDLRQEVCCLQLMKLCKEIFDDFGLSSQLWLKPYRVVSVGSDCGCVQVLTNTMSLDALKKTRGFVNLPTYFKTTYNASPQHLHTARKSFAASLAAYSLFCHIFFVKDRHNGNILVDTEGHIIHIDFGFILSIAPGGNFSLETAPFKLTEEMVEVLGGLESKMFGEFVKAFTAGFIALRQNVESIVSTIQVLALHSPYPCFVGRDATAIVEKLKSRFRVELTVNETVHHCLDLIIASYGHYGTKQYDSFQYYTNGILP